MALSDEQLERIDVLELNLAVARQIAGLEKLDYARYRRILDGWAEQFGRWLPTAAHAFAETPEKWKHDERLFRLGMLAQFLDQQVGIAYDQAQRQAQKRGVKEVRYTDPGDLFLHGLIDTKRGTCANMPVLHVAMGRRLGWPVSLACVKSHFVCRYDDGQVVYNIEATDTGRGGFAAGNDADYIKTEGLSERAVASGSDLRELTAREMLGAFVALRARHFADTNRPALADRSYALSRALFPQFRRAYTEAVEMFLWRGAQLFTPREHGHPDSVLRYLASAKRRAQGPAAFGSLPPNRRLDPMAELERLNALNQANMRRMAPPTAPQPGSPPSPGPQPNRP